MQVQSEVSLSQGFLLTVTDYSLTAVWVALLRIKWASADKMFQSSEGQRGSQPDAVPFAATAKDGNAYKTGKSLR